RLWVTPGTTLAEHNESALPRTGDLRADVAGGLRRATSGLMLCFVDDPPVVFPERLPRPRTVVGHLHVEGLAPTLQHVAIRRAERIRCGVASLWAATREAAEGFSGSRRPTSLRCSF